MQKGKVCKTYKEVIDHYFTDVLMYKVHVKKTMTGEKASRLAIKLEQWSKRNYELEAQQKRKQEAKG